MSVNFQRIEYHQEVVRIQKSVADSIITDNGLTVERFEEVLSHIDPSFDRDPQGSEPTDVESDAFYAIVDASTTVSETSGREGDNQITYEPAAE